MLRYLMCFLFGHNYKIIGYTTKEPTTTEASVNSGSPNIREAAMSLVTGYTLIQRECSFCKHMETTRLLGVCEYVGEKR